MEVNFSLKWKIFCMEWKKIASMEYGKIVFYSIPCPDPKPKIMGTLNLARRLVFTKIFLKAGFELMA